MQSGTVYFVGAGPGNPDLITVRAAKVLEKADVVIVDRLVSVEILKQFVNSDAKIIFVGKQGHCSNSTKQVAINEQLVTFAKKHLCVVRLKGGDTAIFSNILDELIALNESFIPYEIIPGITAASGASAFTGIPLTARGYARGVQILTCCSAYKLSDNEWKLLAEMNNTLVWYMATKEWPDVACRLIRFGADVKTPLLVIEQATTDKQYIHSLLLEDFLDKSKHFEFVTPSIIIVGKVVKLYSSFSWFENKSDRSSYFHTLNRIM